MNNIETRLNIIRMLKYLKKMDPITLLDEDDPNIQKWWAPLDAFKQQFMTDPALPSEIRKVLNRVQPEE